MGGWPVGYLHKAVEELNSGLPRTNPDSSRLEDFNCEEQLKTDQNNTKDELSFRDELATCDGYFLFLRQSNHLRWMNHSLIKKWCGITRLLFQFGKCFIFEGRDIVLDHENIYTWTNNNCFLLYPFPILKRCKVVSLLLRYVLVFCGVANLSLFLIQ